MREGPLSDRQYQQALRDLGNARESQRKEDLRALMSEQWGRRLAYWVAFELGGLHGASFAAAIKDGGAAAQHTAYAEGKRWMAGKFLELVQETSPHDYLAMMAEQIRERQAELALETQSNDESAGDQLE